MVEKWSFSTSLTCLLENDALSAEKNVMLNLQICVSYFTLNRVAKQSARVLNCVTVFRKLVFPGWQQKIEVHCKDHQRP